MGTLTTLNAIALSTTAVTGEIPVLSATMDPLGMMQSSAQHVTDVIAQLNAIINVIPSGSNKTSLQTLVTNLS